MFTEKKNQVQDTMCRMLISRAGKKAVRALACMCSRCR